MAALLVFGDCSVICLPTYGHTAEHQSLRVTLDGGDIVPAADACYFCQTLRERRLPRYVPDRRGYVGLARPARSAGKRRRAHLLRP
jgi:glyoxylase-like metal-dependent hydrolase (beta-lactamase superfamily II)